MYNENDVRLHRIDVVVAAIGRSSGIPFIGEELAEMLEWQRGRAEVDCDGRTLEARRRASTSIRRAASARRRQMSGKDQVESHDRAIARLRGMTSMSEILEAAMSVERTARDFYRALEGRVETPLRDLVHELAEEEQRHYDLFQGLRSNADIADVLGALIAVRVRDHGFSDFVGFPQLGDHPDEQTILQYAMGREHAAAEHYGALAATAPAGPIRDLFRFLADEELRHKGELMKRYREIIRSAGE
jgi:rubrerythrin